ncbi:hypothetical protein F5Y07DRAFT_360808 [Xylaria sp. FL0933]|nr:hypothetical protein F5Y07DRAFT_360808 [Xylaria sp. FL0933]
MLASLLFLSLSAFTATVAASAIPQNAQQDGLVKRQNTATIPTFSFSPSTTVYLGGGPATNATTTTSKQKAPATDTSAPTTPTGSATSSASSTTAANAGSATATATIPTLSFFPSSTVPVSPGATTQPATGGGNTGGNSTSGGGSNTGGNKAGSGAADGNGQTDGQNSLQDLANLLQGLIDLLGN